MGNEGLPALARGPPTTRQEHASSVHRVEAPTEMEMDDRPASPRLSEIAIHSLCIPGSHLASIPFVFKENATEMKKPPKVCGGSKQENRLVLLG